MIALPTAALAAIPLVLLATTATAQNLQWSSMRYNQCGVGKQLSRPTTGQPSSSLSADLVSGPFILIDGCMAGYHCPLKSSECKGTPMVWGCDGPVGSGVCEAFCEESVVDCMMGSGDGDPHMRGFDGSRFDFHGIPSRHFVLFGRNGGGDLVVANMRGATGVDSKGREKPMTYFKQFGVQPGGGLDRLRISMDECPTSGTWVLGAELNGEALHSGVTSKELTVRRLTDTKFEVLTAESIYGFKLMWPNNKAHAHLNVEVSVRRPLRPDDDFVGLLGITAARALAKQNAADSIKPAMREADMREKFAVDSLFPKRRAAILMGEPAVTPSVLREVAAGVNAGSQDDE